MSKSIFTAGPTGEKIRSDCRVSYQPGSKPLNIQVNSKVGVLFGSSLKKLVTDSLNQLWITSGEFILDDFGALPWVIQARIETVIKRAKSDVATEILPEMKEHCLYGTTRDHFRRSRLYLPGNQPKLMINAGIHKPDAVILDLEDAVPPGEKDAARYLVRNALRTLDFLGAERMVRINQGQRGLDDLAFLIPHNVHLILIPKVESAAQVKAVDEQVAAIMKASGRTDPVYFMPILESGRGILKALEIAEASPHNVALAIGLEDYTADIGTQRTVEGRESFFARSMLVNAARAVGIQAIDTVFSDVNDEAGLRQSVQEAKAMGFDGKGCIHPRQIQPIHEAFAPTAEEIEKAKKIVLAADEAEKQGLGVVALGSKMIDPPVVKRAMRTIKLAIDTGIIPANWREEGNH
ncbi:MAG: HpcH/HpaI aldolase/citrate lyase family protein [Candidatus Marinimicrobia bacterium]|nr:HpcH/HpaI aldolase/citrate lyase family protein [Candidatus Neomarinimicrobiota bacterium]MCF7839896.1 HpcH/HpaI aldolase/citrate lyase family protein [Candidatus Neomarinimicrobiota bacterium]MCF7902837.1 HpcH/HpaI aldolase/citrate lyase family protein [Candidatus Neomarinimicrobiota bacterium]